MFVGNGTCVIPRTALFATDKPPKGIAVSMTDPLYDSPSLDHVLPDLLHAQNLPSCLVAHALDVKPGMRVLDMCAAPGGKTTHVAARMGDVGSIEALDRASNRVALLKKTIAAAGLACVNVRKLDATKAPDVFPHSSFDRIVLDAPCSGLGQRPCLSNKLTLEEIVEYGLNQRTLFAAAMKLLRPGGILVYSTCTINPQYVFSICPLLSSILLILTFTTAKTRRLLAGPSASTLISSLSRRSLFSAAPACRALGSSTPSAPSYSDSTRRRRPSTSASFSPSSSEPEVNVVKKGPCMNAIQLEPRRRIAVCHRAELGNEHFRLFLTSFHFLTLAQSPFAYATKSSHTKQHGAPSLSTRDHRPLRYGPELGV